MHAVPRGFEPLFRISEYIDLIGPVYCRRDKDEVSLGLRFEKKHANRRGKGHGAVLSALADIAMGYRLAFSQDPPVPVVTVNLGLDFMGQVELGEWVEVNVTVDRMGRSIAFARCEFKVGERCVARANGVFKIVQRTNETEGDNQ